MSINYYVADRKPAVAGQFYPAKSEELEKEIIQLFSKAAQKKYEHVRAIISPHAGYIFSGTVAASAFNQIDTTVNYKHIFILGSSHHYHFDGAAVYCNGNFIMPYGKEIVDTALGQNLVKVYPDIFTDNHAPHDREHSIEVQLPFLHHVVKGDYKIVPILLGTSDPAFCNKIAKVLKPYLTPENLFIISTDFSHYPSYNDAQATDRATGNAILSGNPENLKGIIAENAKKKIPDLQTSLCGWTSVLTLMYMTDNDDSFRYHEVDSCNSGDVKHYGDRERVVGYRSIVLSEINPEFFLTEQDKQQLLLEARRSIENLYVHSDIPAQKDSSETLQIRCGAFVTLHEQGKLRGCIGMIAANKPLIQTVREMAVSAAKHDYRFTPVTKDELDAINIEVSVLSPLKKVKDIAEIKMGEHGIIIVKGNHTGVFLPQVATETGWNLEEFLGHCARDKAGIGWEGWKDADLYTFTATVFEEKR